MASSRVAELGQVLVDFTVNGTFPQEEAVSAAKVTAAALADALEVLNDARGDLEVEIKALSRESATDVDSWVASARSIKEDVNALKKTSREMVKIHDADDTNAEEIEDKETLVEFLKKEIAFQEQLYTSLQALQHVNTLSNEASRLAEEGRPLDALVILQDGQNFIRLAASKSNLDRSVRAIRLLDSMCQDLKGHIDVRLLNAWSQLVDVNIENESITIHQEILITGGTFTLDQATRGLDMFHELEKAVERFWEDLDEVILRRRTALEPGRDLGKYEIVQNKVRACIDSPDHTINGLLCDVTELLEFLQKSFPHRFYEPLSRLMMPTISTRILEGWLDAAVPDDLHDVVDYQEALNSVSEFTSRLKKQNWPGGDGLDGWVTNASKIWLNKRREKSLDWTRNLFSEGIGDPHSAQRVEKRMVPKDEGNHIALTGATSVTDEFDNWDTAWGGDEEESDQSKNRKSVEEEKLASQLSPSPADDSMADAADAWGWGDDDDTEVVPESEAQPKPTANQAIVPNEREITISEKYWISSLPEPVFECITQIFTDGAYLSQPDNRELPIAPASRLLFGLPNLILALFRAIAPQYYSIVPGGNMYLYNDAFWLSERFTGFVAEWKARKDIPDSCLRMAEKLNPEIQILISFSKRAYTNELLEQRTLIKDLLGGTQNFFHQETILHAEQSQVITTIIKHIREKSLLWESILPYSAWASATGSLVNTVATKLISDVFDLSDIGINEAERLATILSQVEDLDNLFLPREPSPSPTKKRGQYLEKQIPMTAQFAENWMKMKFLGEVLQSNLPDVKYLWFESDLSLYFTVVEVIDLINLSFEMNSEVKAVVRGIRRRGRVRMPNGR